MKQRLIDANALVAFICEGCNGKTTDDTGKCESCVARYALQYLALAPTIDAVPVVRCGECEYHEVFKDGVNGWCNGHGCPTDVTYFCADGERKDGDV